MPNLLQGKKSLFSTKYPCIPKKLSTKKTSAKTKPRTLTIPPDVAQSEGLLGPGKRTRRLPQR